MLDADYGHGILAAAAEIVQSCGGMFRPDGSISRAEYVITLERFLKYIENSKTTAGIHFGSLP